MRVRTLRGRLRKEKISYFSWATLEEFQQTLPISGRTLFSRKGTPMDILEKSLKEEGWLLPNEKLVDCLQSDDRLKMNVTSEWYDDKSDWDYAYPSDWTKEDFEEHERRKHAGQENSKT